MEKPSKKTHTCTQNWVKEAGLVKPSPTFSMEVLQKIETVSQRHHSKPLISSVGWVLILSIVLLSAVILYVYPLKLSVWDTIVAQSTQKWNESMNAIKISDSSFYAFVFLSLFLIQLPFLKKLVDKQLE